MYRLLIFLFKPLVWLIWRPKPVGRENIPKHASGIIVSNHMNWTDPVLLVVLLSHCDFCFMSKRELFEKKFSGWFLRTVHAFPVDRHKADISAIKTAIKRIKSGQLFCIYPEGTRSKTKELLPFESGAAFIQQRAQCPLYVAYISPKRRRGRLPIVFSPAMNVEECLKDVPNSQKLDVLTKAMRDKMVELSLSLENSYEN